MTDKKPTPPPNKPPSAAAPQTLSRRVPLKSIRFRIPVEIPGCSARSSLVEVGRPVPGNDQVMGPQCFWDKDDRVLIVGDKVYPFDGALVEHIERARAAKG